MCVYTEIKSVELEGIMAERLEVALLDNAIRNLYDSYLAAINDTKSKEPEKPKVRLDIED